MKAEFVIVKLYDHTGELVDYDVVKEESNNCCVAARDVDGKRQQFDSCEAYYAYTWAAEHGFEVTMEKRVLEIK